MSEQTPLDRWIAALRSGEFTQATGGLRQGDGYCCLGVACELYLQEHPDVPGWDESNAFWPSHNQSQRRLAVLPGLVQDWLGLRTATGDYSYGHEALTNDNDRGQSFAQIADTIEIRPPGLLID